MSLGLRLVCGGMRWLLKPLLARAGHVGAARFGLRVAALAFPLPFGVAVERHSSGWRLWPKAGSNDQVLLYFHGGAYIAGSPWTHRGLMGRLVRATGARIEAPDYPLAPEHPAPAAFDAAVRAFDTLLAEGVSARHIVLAGDSAGGGLAAALADALAARGTRIGGLVLLSPWTDLTMSGASIVNLAKADPLLPAARMGEVIDQLRGALSPDDPRLSPLFGQAAVAQPTLIVVGADEILLDDSRRLAAHLRAKGAQVELHIEAAAPHVYAYLAPYLPESRRAIRKMARFCNGLAVNPLPPPPSGS
jgi:epsilon-lactone hydrolase